MKLHTHDLSHLGLRVTDLARAKRFYVDTLGCQVMRVTDGVVLINAYGTLIGLKVADAYSSRDDHFDPFRVWIISLLPWKTQASTVRQWIQDAALEVKTIRAGKRNRYRIRDLFTREGHSPVFSLREGRVSRHLVRCSPVKP